MVAAPAAAEEPMLLGVLVDGREIGSLEVLRRGDEFLLPVDGLSEVLGLDLAAYDTGFILATPLGHVEVEKRELTLVGGVFYLPQRFVTDRLATGLSFDEPRFALDLDPPWRPDRGRTTGAGVTMRQPDILAPRTTLSGLSGRLTHTTIGESSYLSGSAQLRGRALEGLWKVRLDDSETRTFQVREYEWSTRVDRTSYLVGRQRLQLHPSLGGFDVAGFQMGWSNRYPDEHTSMFEADGLFSHTARPVENFSGTAPPGSFVQLRIENRVVDTQQVGYSGVYEFDEVPLPSRQLAEIEVLVFDRHNKQVPLETRRYRMATSNLLLPPGTVVHTGGFGATGTFTERFFDSPPEARSSSGAFYQWRQGFSTLLTAEAAVQYAGSRFQSYTGLVARLSDTWTAGFGFSYTPGALGHSLSLEGFMPRWRLFARSMSTPSAFDLVDTGLDRRDHVVETFHDPHRTLTVGLTARLRDDGSRESRYVLPSLTWRPVPEIYLDVRPDVYGDYLGNASWSMRRDTRARLFVARVSDFELSHDLNDRYQLGLNHSFGGGLPARYTLAATRRPLSVHGWSVRAGVVYTDGELGYLAGVNTPILPGLQIQAEYQSIPYRSFVGDDNLGRLLISVSTDLSRVGGGFHPARSVQQRRARGSVGGRIRIDEAAGIGPEGASRFADLSGVAVMVDQRVRARTDASGRFFVDNLAPGYHVVELDPERLPIELNLLRPEFVAEVESGSVTRVDFRVRREFGCAGRVIDAGGQAVTLAVVELLDLTGSRIDRTYSDSFGLYRFDGIPPGEYLLRVVRDLGDHVRVLAERALRVSDDFLFHQDLVLAAAAIPVPVE